MSAREQSKDEDQTIEFLQSPSSEGLRVAGQHSEKTRKLLRKATELGEDFPTADSRQRTQTGRLRANRQTWRRCIEELRKLKLGIIFLRRPLGFQENLDTIHPGR